MVARSKILSIVLAGGEGKRLMPLTSDRAKPAVLFGGSYRLIDFVLSNLAKYDRYGKAGLEGRGGFSSSGFSADFDLGDIFNSFFGGGFGPGASSRKRSSDKYPLDLEIALRIKFNEAVFGTEKEIDFTIKKPCQTCKGSGSKDGKTHVCPHCEGRGRISQQRGFMSFV